MELTSVTRRAFVPVLFVQIYYATPTLFYLLGGAEKAAGGVNQITIPIQGQSMVQGQFTGPAGGFNQPQIIPALQNAQFSLAYWVVPVPLYFGERILQATDTVISTLKARMNDVWNVTVQNFATLAFQGVGSTNPLFPNGFADGFDNGTNYQTYGGINRLAPGNTSWQGQYYTAATGAGLPGTAGYTRATMSNAIIQFTFKAGGEPPSLVVMNPGDFATLNTDFIGTEQIFGRPGPEYNMATPVRSSFPNLNVAGVPIYADSFCPAGQIFAVNSKYTKMYIDEDAAFDFSGFYPLIPLGQIGQQGVMVTGYNVITAKCVANATVVGVANAAFTASV
ncbi:MAG TPA: hypothetical protein VGR84_18995 [Candidatus Acidoferrales bacterium]|nr:hypothetical protein [Candidatus Acidoferrales bacterium]